MWGKAEEAQKFGQIAEETKQRILEHGLDGERFLRAYDARGRKAGSRDCAEGQIFIEPQGLYIMAGIGLEDGKTRRALGAVYARLATSHGILLHQPAYTRYYYLRINPSAREELNEVHKLEPYVSAQMITGRDAPTFWEAKDSWLTGTAAWMYQAATQYVLGIRPTYHSLLLDPCIPASWQGFRASCVFRGARYNIIVRNPNGVLRA